MKNRFYPMMPAFIFLTILLIAGALGSLSSCSKSPSPEPSPENKDDGLWVFPAENSDHSTRDFVGDLIKWRHEHPKLRVLSVTTANYSRHEPTFYIVIAVENAH